MLTTIQLARFSGAKTTGRATVIGALILVRRLKKKWLPDLEEVYVTVKNGF
jgi:hypothetical protein